jgi:hypothetical protein
MSDDWPGDWSAFDPRRIEFDRARVEAAVAHVLANEL